MKIKNRIKKYPRLTKSFGQVRDLCLARRRRMFGDSGAGFCSCIYSFAKSVSGPPQANIKVEIFG